MGSGASRECRGAGPAARRGAAPRGDLGGRGRPVGPVGPVGGPDTGCTLSLVIQSDAPLGQILDALTEAAARHFLRFDLAIDARTDIQDDWLDVTHRLTNVDATRTAVGRWNAPERWRFVLQAAWFVARAAALDGPMPEISDASIDAAQLTVALERREAARVVGGSARWLAEGRATELRRVFMDACLADLVVRPIVVVTPAKYENSTNGSWNGVSSL